MDGHQISWRLFWSQRPSDTSNTVRHGEGNQRFGKFDPKTTHTQEFSDGYSGSVNMIREAATHPRQPWYGTHFRQSIIHLTNDSATMLRW
jgi:hypothetical protein